MITEALEVLTLLLALALVLALVLAPDPAPDPGPITTPIYAWPTLCTLRGDIETDGAMPESVTGCGASGTGTSAADTVCKDRYAMTENGTAKDAGTSTERDKIARERGANLRHRALIASSSQSPAGFDIPNKGGRELHILTTYLNPALTDCASRGPDCRQLRCLPRSKRKRTPRCHSLFFSCGRGHHGFLDRLASFWRQLCLRHNE